MTLAGARKQRTIHIVVSAPPTAHPTCLVQIRTVTTFHRHFDSVNYDYNNYFCISDTDSANL